MPAAYDRCVDHVRGSVRNPHAVCTASNAGDVRAYRRRSRRRAKNPHDPAPPLHRDLKDPMHGFHASFAAGLAEHMAAASMRNSLSYNRGCQPR